MKNFKSSSYVQALYDLGVETNSIDVLYETSKTWLELISQNMNFLSYLSDVSVDRKEKNELISKLTDNQLFRDFVNVVMDDKNIKGLRIILNKFVKRINKEKGILNGTIYTTEKIDSSQVKQIEEAMSKKLNTNVNLSNIIDQEIIGGIKVVIEDDVWDYSIASQIKELSIKIIEERGE